MGSIWRNECPRGCIVSARGGESALLDFISSSIIDSYVSKLWPLSERDSEMLIWIKRWHGQEVWNRLWESSIIGSILYTVTHCMNVGKTLRPTCWNVVLGFEWPTGDNLGLNIRNFKHPKLQLKSMGGLGTQHLWTSGSKCLTWGMGSYFWDIHP